MKEGKKIVNFTEMSAQKAQAKDRGRHSKYVDIMLRATVLGLMQKYKSIQSMLETKEE